MNSPPSPAATAGQSERAPLSESAALLAQQDAVGVLRRTLVSLSAAAAAGVVVAGLWGDVHALEALLATLVAFPVLAWLAGRGHAEAAAIGLCLVVLTMATYVVGVGAGLHDIGMLLFPLVMVVAGVLVRRRSARLVIVTTVIVGSGIGVLEYLQILQTAQSRRVRIEVVLEVFLMLSASAAVVWILTARLLATVERNVASERRYNQIFDATNEGIVVHDGETGQIIDVNAAACRLFARERTDMLGWSWRDVAGAEAHLTEAQLVEHVRKASQDGPQFFDWRVRRPDGSTVDVEVSLKASQIESRQLILAVIRDVTEKRAIQAKVQEGDKLRSVGQLAGGVAHDFNNQLTGILGSARLLERHLPAESPGRGHLSVIQTAAQRSADLTRQLLAFARKGKRRNVRVNVSQLIDETVDFLERSLDKRIRLVRPEQAVPLYVMGDPSQLENAFLNLALNARDAMPEGGELRFSIDKVDFGPDTVRRRPAGVGDGLHVAIEVSDTGTGMDAETQARIFEPFFTTRERGSGMGLAAVYGTVQEHAGGIAIESAPGKGARFTIYLPASVEDDDDASSSSPVPMPQMLAGLSVLVVDDDPLVGQLAVRILTELGCQAHHVDGGQAALDLLAAAPRRFSAVLLDHDMPGMTGAATMARMHEVGLDIPVVFTSGYTGDLEPTVSRRAQAFLAKPYSPEELAAALLKALKRRG